MAARDAALEARLGRVSADKAAVAGGLAAHAGVLAERRAELDALASRERLLAAELDAQVRAPLLRPVFLCEPPL